MSICTDLLIEPKRSQLHVLGNHCDACWVYGYGPETKQMSSHWSTSSSPRPKKVRQVKSNIKTMLIALFDIDGLVHHEFVPTGQTVNKEFYKTVLQCLRDAVRRHRPEKWRSGNWILHHDKPLPTGLSPQINFWRNTTFRRTHNLPSPLTLLCMTSSCSHN